jgi:hypothetical protein
MYIRIYVHIYIYTYIHSFIHTYLHTRTYIYIYVYIYIYISRPRSSASGALLKALYIHRHTHIGAQAVLKRLVLVIYI